MPSWPLSPVPKHHISIPESKAQVCEPSNDEPAMAMTSVRSPDPPTPTVCTGVVRWVVVPSPS